VLTSGKEEVVMSFQSRLFGGKLPSDLIFVQSVLKNTVIVSAYGVVGFNKCLTYITNETLTSRRVRISCVLLI
jgi:hypothetical protein